MSNDNVVPDKITQAIMRVCTPEEMEALSDTQMTALIIKIAKRLNEDVTPTLAELNAIKELIVNGAVQMSKEPASPSDISAAALKVCSREELVQMPRPQRMNFLGMIERRLNKETVPTLDELQGIKELSEHLWPPAINDIYRAQAEALPKNKT